MNDFPAAVLWLFLLIFAGCVSTPATTSPAVRAPSSPSPIPSLHIEKTTIGLGRSLEGLLVIEGHCVRVQGMALAWSRTTNASVLDNVFRFQNRQGEVLLLHSGDRVLVDGGCIIRDPEWSSDCVTPTLEEARATSPCETGPYFITSRIRKITPTLQPPSSP